MSKAADLANLIGNINAGGGGVNRNLIINGAMNVSQRGDVTGVTSGTPYGGPDRFTLGITNAGTYSMSQSSTVPSGKGFANSYKIDCTTADTSIAADHEVTIQYKFEGQDLQTIKKGTSEAKPITVSFYCRSNLTGTFTLEIFDNDNSRQCSKNYTISDANTWEFKSITFPADTTGTFDDDNAQSATLVFWLASGSNATSGTQNTSAFASNTTANRVSSSIVNMSSSTDNEFLLTGVQFEVGQNATTFEHEPFDVTLRKCNRYFEKVEVTAGSYAHVAYAYTTTGMRAKQTYEKKRANPTFSFDNQGDVIVFYNGNSSDTDPTWNYHDAGPNSCRVSITLTGVSTTAGYAVAAYVNGSVTYNIKVDAEL